jgi:spermidine/putrescine transport system ATP-binding protein
MEHLRRLYNEPNTVICCRLYRGVHIFSGKMSGEKKVSFCGAELPCLDDFHVGADVDVVIRPEDIEMTAPEKGQIKGTVQSVIFKGMHYDIAVRSGDNEVLMKSTKNAVIGEELGLTIEPDVIHVIYAQTQLIHMTELLRQLVKGAFADGEFHCDVTNIMVP